MSVLQSCGWFCFVGHGLLSLFGGCKVGAGADVVKPLVRAERGATERNTQPSRRRAATVSLPAGKTKNCCTNVSSTKVARECRFVFCFRGSTLQSIGNVRAGVFAPSWSQSMHALVQPKSSVMSKTFSVWKYTIIRASSNFFFLVWHETRAKFLSARQTSRRRSL